jgi:peroxiredoxin
MKRLIWISIAAVLLYACKPHTGYTVKGELANANGMKVMLLKVIANSDDRVKLDSSVVKKGKFQMKGTLEYPEYCVLYVGDYGPLQMIVENTEINIAVNLKNIQDSKVTGSNETDLFVEYKDSVIRMDTMRQQRVEYMRQFVSEHPNSITAAMVVNNNPVYYFGLEELEIFYDGFDEVNCNSQWVQGVIKKVETARRLAIGQPFVDVSFPAPDGKEIALSDYTGNDKYVLINFWASWSKSCRKDNPQLVKLYKKFQNRGFEMVGISLDRNKSEWVRAIKADSLTWPQMSDLKFWQSEGAKLYMVDSIPYNILLDKDGTILARGFQPDESGKHVELEKKLKELMENPEKTDK